MQAFPPLAEVIAAGRKETPVYGIYTWAYEYERYRDDIREMGFTNVRLGGTLGDSVFRMIAEDGLELVYTLTYAQEYVSDKEVFIEKYVEHALRLCQRYGENGEFFTLNPDVPYRPLRYLEIWNEPNFQYLLPNDAPIQDKAELYADLLIAVYRAVKGSYPSMQIVGFSCGGASAAAFAERETGKK